MKKLLIICSIILAIGMLSAGNAFAVGYCKDVTPGTKNFQETLTLSEGDTVTIDIYINDIRTGDHLISAGFVSFYPSSIEIVSITPDVAWDPSKTVIGTSTPGFLFVDVGNSFGVGADGANDVRIAAVEIHCLDFGFDDMLFVPDWTFDMIVSIDDSYVYDEDITPNIFTFNQVRCCDIDDDCSDGIYCNGIEYCAPDPDCTTPFAGKCFRALAPINCDDGIYCTVGYCNEAGYCEFIPRECIPDGNICTDDVCDELGCIYVNNTNPCDDGIYCNGTDVCGGGSCSMHIGNPCSPLICWENLDRCECFADHDCDGICDPGESDPSCTGSDDCPYDPYNYIDNDGLCAYEDNCPEHHNPGQEDTMPPSGNSDPAAGIYCGDACECEGDFEPDGDVDGTDAVAFKTDFFRKDCAELTPCDGDFECDGDVDGTDAFKFKSDFFRKDCPSCGGWPCGYE